MVRNFLLISFLIIVGTTANAQVRFSVGVGAATNHFQNSIENLNLVYENQSVTLPHFHIQTAMKPNPESRFIGMIQWNIMPKQIRFDNPKYVSDGSIITDSYYHLYGSLEMELAIGYEIPIRKLTLVPQVGFFVSGNYYSTTSKYKKITEYPNVGYLTHTSYGSSRSFSGQQSDFSLYSGFSFGLSLNKKTKNNRTIGLFTNAYLTPSEMLEEPLEMVLDNLPIQVQGKYQYVNIGLRFGLNKH
jgi:hypothetical protein